MLELSLHVPLVVLSVWPCIVVPLTVGAAMLIGGTGSGGTGSDPPVVVVGVVVVDPGLLVTLAGVPPMYIETGQVCQVRPLFQVPGRDCKGRLGRRLAGTWPGVTIAEVRGAAGA